MAEYIDRKVLLREMEKLYNKRTVEAAMTGYHGCCVSWNDAVYLVTVAPTIEAEPIIYDTGSWQTTVTDLPPVGYAPIKHGRWIRLADQSPWHECSECGERTGVVNLNGKVVYNYCPNCGATMDLDEVEK